MPVGTEALLDVANPSIKGSIEGQEVCTGDVLAIKVVRHLANILELRGKHRGSGLTKIYAVVLSMKSFVKWVTHLVRSLTQHAKTVRWDNHAMLCHVIREMLNPREISCSLLAK